MAFGQAVLAGTMAIIPPVTVSGHGKRACLCTIFGGHYQTETPMKLGF